MERKPQLPVPNGRKSFIKPVMGDVLLPATDHSQAPSSSISRRKSSVTPEHTVRRVSMLDKPLAVEHSLRRNSMIENDTQPTRTEPQSAARRRSMPVPYRFVPNEGYVADHPTIPMKSKNFVAPDTRRKSSTIKTLIPGTHQPGMEAKILQYMEDTASSKTDQGEWMEAFLILEKSICTRNKPWAIVIPMLPKYCIIWELY